MSHPCAPIMMTVEPATVSDYARGVEYLLGRGFRYLIYSMNYAGAWDTSSLEVLRQEYQKLAKLYERLTRKEEKFYLSPFEVKLSSHIQGDDYCTERCELGKKQLSVAPDGHFYPCVQFVDDIAYNIGPSKSGVDHGRMLLPIADALGNRLYRSRNAMFLQKQYNNMFPLLSLLEDRS